MPTKIAIVYDYDLTLSPRYMQDEAIFPHFGVDAGKFWQRCSELVEREGFDSELAYMKNLLDTLRIDRPSNADLRKLGEKLTFYPGLPEMFEELEREALTEEQRSVGIHIEHYIVSSGLKALLEGSRLAKHVRAIFGCEFAEDEMGRICFPSRVISHTQKTQFLYRINKGYLDMSQDVNDFVPEEARPVPFCNMIYIGDGPTDIPCFTVMQRNGGHAIAVYNPEDPTRRSFRKCFELAVHAQRVRCFAPSDYRAGSQLRLILEEFIQEIAGRILGRMKEETGALLVRAPGHR
ncbi:MAG: haloacid dehalogenase-like hydrolase [Chthoniobacterales bacterium]|nr:haloacid dehalogenase-like hydrolase [Chthoniobacterales bacterium]